MQHMARRILCMSTAGAFSFYMVHNRTKKSTVFATPISDADIKTTRFQNQDSDTEVVTFSLIEDTHEEPLSNGLELRNVQIFFRHGARTPLAKLPGLPEVHFDKRLIMTYVPYSRVNHVVENIKGGPRPESSGEKAYAKHHFWGGCVAGTLTALGRDQMFLLGRQLHSLYIQKQQFLDNVFNPKQIQIQSTNYNRCIQSMECVIAGMFGQHSFDNKAPLVIPVHHESEETLYPNFGCPILKSIGREGQQYLASLDSFRNVVHKISHRLGLQLDPKEVDMIMWRDNLMVRKALGLPIPSELLEILPEIDYEGIRTLQITVQGPPNQTDFMMRVTGMPFSRLIENNIRNACYHPDSAPKLQMYACHDSSIVLLLSMFNCFDHHWPPYSANIRLELYEAPGCPDRYWMKILYCDKAVVMRGFNSEDYPYICMDMFSELLKRYNVSSVAEYFKLSGCNMYTSVPAAGGNVGNRKNENENENKDDKETRPKKRGGYFWA